MSDDMKKVSTIIRDIADNTLKIEGYKSIIKESKDVLLELGLDRKSITKMISLFIAQNNEEYFQEQRDMEDLYSRLFETDTVEISEDE